MRTDTTVADVTVTEVAFPDPPLRNCAGLHEPWAIRSVMQLRTVGGFAGLSESYGDENFLAAVRRVGREVPGLSVFDVNGLAAVVARTLGGSDIPDAHGLIGPSSVDKSLARVLAFFEVAFLDAAGRVSELPVHALLGGRVRASVPFSAYLFYKWAAHRDADEDRWGEALDPDGIVAQAHGMINEFGFSSIKLKGGVFPVEQEIAAIRALAEEFPGRPLRLDPNAAWSVDTSHRVARELTGVLEYLEDPTPGLAGMAAVAARTTLPLATNMCVVGFGDLARAIPLGSVGVVLADHHFWGGMRASLQLAKICDVFGLGMSMHSNTHLGISLAAMTQLAAAIPNLTYACDTHRPWNAADVVVAPPVIVDGAVTVSDTPGLGVDLDVNALAELHENYLRAGITRRDDGAYMRRYRPDFRQPVGTW